MPLRLLARAAPLVLSAFAAAIWLRRREPERPALPALLAPPKPQSSRFARAEESAPVDIVAVVDDLLGAPR